MDKYLTPPPGWYYSAYPWFAMDEIETLPNLVQVGHVLLPEFFHLCIGTEDMWHKDWPVGDGVVLFLNFQVFEGGIELSEARSVPFDLPMVFERVSQAVPPKRWKALGVNYMTQYLAHLVEDERLPDNDPLADSRMRRRPEQALEWLERLRDHAADAYATARDQPSPRRKRARLTDEFLREVAAHYRSAEDMGEPPTRGVANHFKAPHSTAAKWVATARRRRFLPPAEHADNEAARSAARAAAQSSMFNDEEVRAIAAEAFGDDEPQKG